MKASNFSQANQVLQKPSNMTDEECGPLPVFTDKKFCISKWKMNWIERLHCLFKGYVWVFVQSGSTQPPIKVMAYKSAFENDNGK